MFELSRIEILPEELGSDSPGKRWIIEGWESDEHAPFLTNPDADLADAREWAERMLAETTDYRVTGWSVCTPHLHKLNHTLTAIVSSSNGAIVLDISSGAQAESLIGMLRDADAVWRVERAPRNVCYIPVRNITYAEHAVTITPV
jgi:hypothetical protein